MGYALSLTLSGKDKYHDILLSWARPLELRSSGPPAQEKDIMNSTVLCFLFLYNLPPLHGETPSVPTEPMQGEGKEKERGCIFYLVPSLYETVGLCLQHHKEGTSKDTKAACYGFFFF